MKIGYSVTCYHDRWALGGLRFNDDFTINFHITNKAQLYLKWTFVIK